MLQINISFTLRPNTTYSSGKTDENLQITMHLLGLIGELLMFVVYYQRGLCKLSVSVYFRIMASVGLIKSVFFFSIMRNLQVFSNFSHSIFETSVYINNLFVPISVWLEVTASLDRFVAISFPTRFKFIHKRPFQRTAMILLVFNTALYASTIYSKKTASELNSADRSRYFFRLNIMDLVNSLALPFLLMMLMSIATFVGVVRVHKRMRSSNGRGGGRSQNRKLIRDIKFGVTILILNILFFIFISLYRLYKFIPFNPFDSCAQPFWHLLFVSVIMNISEYYYLSNFYFQLSVNSVVRSELFKIFKRIAIKIRMLPFFKVKQSSF